MANKYGTANPVLIEARIAHDPYDEFGWVQEWRLAICEFLAHFRGTAVEGFRCSHAYPGLDIESMTDESYALNELFEARPSVEELTYALKVLDRYREWLRIAGRDY